MSWRDKLRSNWLAFRFLWTFAVKQGTIKWGLIFGLLIIIIRLVLWII